MKLYVVINEDGEPLGFARTKGLATRGTRRILRELEPGEPVTEETVTAGYGPMIRFEAGTEVLSVLEVTGEACDEYGEEGEKALAGGRRETWGDGL